MRNGAPRRKGPTSMTDGRKRAFGVEGADVGLGLRPKNIGARVKRVEDPRLLIGQGSFTADRIVPGALHVAFRRSDHAHALIASIWREVDSNHRFLVRRSRFLLRKSNCG